MRKSTKTMIRVGAILAALDAADMVSKGQVVHWMRVAYPEAAREFEETNGRFDIRSKIISKIADYFEWISDQL